MDIYGHLIHDMHDEAARVMESLVTPIRADQLKKFNKKAHNPLGLHHIAPDAPIH